MTSALRLFPPAFALAMLLASPAGADCFADYKAKQESPYRLHYGVMKIDSDPCTMSNSVTATVSGRLQAAGWQLLAVQSVFDESGLESRKQDAGGYFLRF